MTKRTVGIAGSTEHTRICAEALRAQQEFEVLWVLTPPPQPIGRKQVITKNPLHIWAEEHHIPVIHVERKITPDLQAQLQPQPDFLLVVDFGYLVPKWMLDWPKIAPLNVHPSLLPRWRGSSPGQFVLLYGEKTSSVTIMIMGAGLDTGPILWQGNIEVEDHWTQTEYYQHSFELAAQHLPTVMQQLADGEITPVEQPEESPTPIAKRFTKDDGFVAWKTVADSLQIPSIDQEELATQKSSTLLKEIQSSTGKAWSEVLGNAIRGLSPWPGVWTYLPTTKGIKRMKILSLKNNNGKAQLDQVQLEGQQVTSWQSLKSLYLSK